MFIRALQDLKDELVNLQEDSSINSIMLFASAENNFSFYKIEQVLKLNFKPLLGGIFPEIIANGKREKSGFVIIGMNQVMHVESCNCNQPLNFQEIDKIPNINSVLCFVDAFWDKKTKFMNTLYDEIGPFVSYLGAGAGSLKLTSTPCVFVNQKVIQNAAVVGFLETKIKTAVAHGWKPFSKLLKVTETVGNKITSLNWKPAFSVYKEIIEAHSKLKISPTNFFDVAKSYPLGLIKLDDEMLVRDPIETDGVFLKMIDEVPQGEYVKVMHGNIDSLLDGAKEIHSSLSNSKDSNYKSFCIDCISRVLFLENEFDKELEIINPDGGCNGVLSIGEIVNSKSGNLELHNKTIVLGRWN